MKTKLITTTFFAIAFISLLFIANSLAGQVATQAATITNNQTAQAATNFVTADFDIYKQSNTIHVVDQSSGTIHNRLWDMDDGGYKVDKVIFSHPYKIKGLHKVCLTVQGAFNTDTMCKKVIVK